VFCFDDIGIFAACSCMSVSNPETCNDRR